MRSRIVHSKTILFAFVVIVFLSFQTSSNNFEKDPDELILRREHLWNDTIFKNKSLKKLVCISCHFDSIEVLHYFSELTYLKLEGSSGLRDFGNIEKLTQLTYLNLSHSDLVSFNPRKSNITTKLTNLNLMKCPGLTTIDSSISILKNLQVIWLNNNHNLTQLPKEIWDLEKVESLWLGNTNITYISPKVAEMKHLKVLWVNWRNIKNASEVRGLLKKSHPNLRYVP